MAGFDPSAEGLGERSIVMISGARSRDVGERGARRWRAVADLDVEAPYDGAHHREIFLILRRHAGQLDGAAAVRTRGWRRCWAGLVDLCRTRAALLPAVVRTSAPAGSPAATLGPVLGEGSGLPDSCPPRRVELLLEVFTAALPLIPVALDPRQLLPQPCDLSLFFLNAGIAGILLRPGTLPWHPTVMPDPLEKYKSIILDLAHQETTPLNKYPSDRYYLVAFDAPTAKRHHNSLVVRSDVRLYYGMPRIGL